MHRLAALWTAIGLAFAVPVAAQDPIPRDYAGSGIIERADPDKSAARRAREEAAATTAEAACAAGEVSDCGALGKAYLYGEGKPQNRPVAELLLRRACDAADAAGCLWLGELFWSVNEPEPGAAALRSFQRGCLLGSLEACARAADALETGPEGLGGDPAAAAALRQDSCARGGVAACRALAAQQITDETSPAEQAEGQAVLDRQCRAGDRQSCVAIADWLRDYGAPLTPTMRAILAAGCAAGEGAHCHDLAAVRFAEGSGPPAGRSAGIALYERACELDSKLCAHAQAIRAHPPLAETCARTDRAACTALGTLYADRNSPLYSPAEAVVLLGQACEAGDIAQCAVAASVQLYDLAPAAPESIALAAHWYASACDGGSNADCQTLGRALIDGDRFAPDRARGYALLVRACERDFTASCDELVNRAKTDPDAPIPAADSRFSAPLAEGEEDPRETELREQSWAETAKLRARACTSTSVIFDGVTYDDTICTSMVRVRNGFPLKPGQAPWQALLWRPERLNGQALTPAQRVLCGGALIAEGWILTAAHCVTDQAARLDGRGYSVRLGVFNPRVNEGVSYPVVRTVAHPRYSPRSLAFDIALVQFDPRAGRKGSTTNAIARIRLDPQPLGQRPIRSGVPVFTYGWGWTAAENSGSTDNLRGVRLALTDPATCTALTSYRRSLQDVALCAGGPDSGQACKGDSGGPLITYGDPGLRPTVIGVLSSGHQCGVTGVPSRYTRVAKVRDWIDRVMEGRQDQAVRIRPARSGR